MILTLDVSIFGDAYSLIKITDHHAEGGGTDESEIKFGQEPCFFLRHIQGSGQYIYNFVNSQDHRCDFHDRLVGRSCSSIGISGATSLVARTSAGVLPTMDAPCSRVNKRFTVIFFQMRLKAAHHDCCRPPLSWLNDVILAIPRVYRIISVTKKMVSPRTIRPKPSKTWRDSARPSF